MKINEILTEQQGVAEGRYFKTSYGWAGGSKPSGGTYKHPEQIRADREAKKKAKEKQKNKPQGVAETSDYSRRREREEAIISGKKPARKKSPAQTSDYARRREQERKAGVREGFTADDTNDYYADYYTDLLSQIRNMSWTDRATTKANVKRDLDSGRIKLPDLKLEIRNLDREIRAKQGVSEGQKR